MQFERTELERALDPTYLARGIRYASEQRITGIESTQGGRLLAALVRGSQARPYRVVIRLGRGSAGELVVGGQCTCPVGYNCKHVAAVLWNYADSPEAKAADSGLSLRVVTWLEALQRAAVAEDRSPETLLYVLDVRAGPLPKPVLETFVVRRLKNGGWGQPRPYNLTPSSRTVFLEPSDLQVAALLGAMTRRYPQTLNGPLAVETLRRMIGTDRAHFGEVTGPSLRLGEARAATLRWQADGDGRQRAVLVAEGSPARVLWLEPPWYLEPETGVCGPLETGLTPALLTQLLNAPDLDPADAASVAEQMRQLPGLGSLPRPRALALRRLPKLKPTPCLTLTSERRELEWAEEDEMQWAHLVRLSFDYAGRRIPGGQPGDRIRYTEGDELIQLPRDLPAEAAATKRLEQLGLLTLGGLWSEHGPDVFAPVDGLSHWLRLLASDLPALAQSGWRIEQADGFRLSLLEPQAWYADIEESGNDWFDLELGVEVEGRRVPLAPLLAEVVEHWSRSGQADPLAQIADGAELALVLPEGGVLRLPVDRVRAILATVLELYDPAAKRGDAVRLPRLAAHRLPELDGITEEGVRWRGGEAVRAFAERLRNFKGLARVSPPAGLAATLRDYQRDGLDWLQFLREHDIGGVLADDMGLGKTVQSLAHIVAEKEAGRLERPALVVAPTSLVVNWRREAERFAPELRVLVLHGPQRKERFAEVAAHDLVLTTYPLLARDLETLATQEYHLLVLDEAQYIKNPRAKVSQAAKALRARHRLCLTGTPMENHLGELWSLFDFLLPGFLGEAGHFRRLFRTPIEQYGDEGRRTALTRRVAPFLLRRTKTEVVRELPPKTEIERTVGLGARQRDLYEGVRVAMHEKVRQAIARKGLERSHIEVLEALLRLRQICCDPRLIASGKAATASDSAKLELLLEMLPELIEEGRRVLLFSQFTSMLALIEPELERLGISYVKLTGRTRDRASPVERFQAGEVPLFLISLKAGGTGLNLTAADTVIHYDPWWNPAVERQATDRAHRIGQDKPVFVYKLLTEGTVEEKIAELQARKAQLAEALFGERRAGGPALTAADLEALFEPL